MDELLRQLAGAGEENEAPLAALHAELTADGLLEFLTEVRGPHTAALLDSVADGLLRRGGGHADRALAGLAIVGSEQGRDVFARRWRDRLALGSVDPIAAAIGADRATGCIEIAHATGDGVNLFLTLDGPLGPATLGIYVDHNLGGIAKDALIGPDPTEAIAIFDPAEGFEIRHLSPAEAVYRFDRALAHTRDAEDPPISEDLDELIPLVLRRVLHLRPARRRPRERSAPAGPPAAPANPAAPTRPMGQLGRRCRPR